MVIKDSQVVSVANGGVQGDKGNLKTKHKDYNY